MWKQGMNLEIDIKNIIQEKSPGLARFIPELLFRKIKRIIRQDEINQVLRDHGHLKGTAFIQAVLNDWGYKPNIIIRGNIDPSKRYIFASNHPLGGLDGLILANEIEKRFGSVKVMVNDLLMNLEPIKSLFIPVNKYGKQSVSYAKELDKMYRSDSQVLLFPAGLCSRRINFKIQDTPWQKNVITKSVQHQREIVPVFFDATNTKRFYRMASLRKALGIKKNIELVLLPGEMFRQSNKHMNIILGEPIPYEMFTKEKQPLEWATWLREHVYQLKEGDK